MIVSVDIDVAKDKHDCFVQSSEGEVFVDVFIFSSNMNRFNTLLEKIPSPITTIPGIGYQMGAMILSETGDFSRFDSPDKLLAYAGMSPSTYQSGQLKNCYSHMEKRGSRYLRYALYNATNYVCLWDTTLAAYLTKKGAESKHYNVAISHAATKPLRIIFAIE